MSEQYELLRKDFTPAQVELPFGERSFIAWITMDIVDNEGDVVIASGVDTKSVFLGVQGDPTKPGNPVVMAIHDYQKWPLGTCDWIRLAKPYAKSTFGGLKAKTFIDEDPDALKVFGMIQRRVVRGVSIGFRPADDMAAGEWGPPTREELRSRPDWKTARRIIRRCVLLEYSVVPIPMNQGALIVAVSKGLELPSYLKGKVTPMNTPFGAGQHVKCKGMGCGTVKSLHPDGVVPDDDDAEDTRPEDDRDGPAALVDMHDGQHERTGNVKCVNCKDMGDYGDAEDKGLSGSSGTAGGYLDEPSHGDPNTSEPPSPAQSGRDVDEEDDRDEEIHKGDRVKWVAHKGLAGGCGVVKSIHKSGKVPGVINEIEGSPERPCARIKCYKSMDDPHQFHETDQHVGVHLHRLEKMDGMGFSAKGVVAFKASPLAEGSWDAAAARKRLERWAAGNMSRYRQGFAWYDAEKPEDVGSYKLPIKDIRNGRLVCVRDAISAALSVVDGGRGGLSIPETDKADVKSLLERYKAEWDEDEPKSVPQFRTAAQWEASIERQAREQLAAERDDSVVQDAIDRITGAI